LKKNGNKISGWLKSNYKGLFIVFVMVIASILINAYIGFGPTSPSPLPLQNNTNIISNTKANPFAMRISFNLNIIMNNRSLTIPSQIGIEQSLWHNHTLDKYGSAGLSMQGQVISGMAPIYTNDDSGVVKVGSTVIRNYTLGDFFNIWGFDLKGKNAYATINGKSVSDYKDYVLKNNDNIELRITGSK
jgi:hypothetical protein